jgi:hypothetical protein
MSRANPDRAEAEGLAEGSGGRLAEGLAETPGKAPADAAAAGEAAKAAEYIGLKALELAKCANAAGLTALSHLLESAALEAGALAVERRWPDDAGEA